MNRIAISLGWNCSSASWAAEEGIRLRKANGYRTCPFDEMISNLPGVIQCIDDDFAHFCDPRHLVVEKVPDGLEYVNYDDYCTEIIRNTRYNFVFNHESPGHPFLCEQQHWPNGKYHYTENGFAEFVNRYSNRITAFREYINDTNSKIAFILTRWNTAQQDIVYLREVIERKHPRLEYDVILRNTDRQLLLNSLRFMNVDPESHEIRRLL